MNDRDRMNCELECEDYSKICFRRYIKLMDENEVLRQDRINKWFNDNYDESYVRDNIDIDKLNMDLSIICRECTVISGRVDIICEDICKNKIPIEIKKGSASDSAVGQILGYMKTLGSEQGIIIARAFSKRLIYIANDYNIQLFCYTIDCNIDHILTFNLEKLEGNSDIFSKDISRSVHRHSLLV